MNNIQSIQSLYPTFENLQKSIKDKALSLYPIFQGASFLNLKERLIRKIDQCEEALDRFIPNFDFQTAFDRLWKQIDIFKSSLSPEFHTWLHDTGNEGWFHQLATFLAKLPIRVAYNVAHHLFTLIKVIISVPVHVVMHPMKVPLRLAKLLIELVHALSQPETWSRIGMGVMGSTWANAAVSGNPLAVVAFGIAAALSFAGISVGALKTAVLAQEGERIDHVKHYLLKEIKHLPEDLMTGFCTVLLFEGVQQAMRGIQRTCQRISRAINHASEVRNSQIHLSNEQLGQFMGKYQLPHYDHVDYHGTSYSVGWRLDKAQIHKFLDDLPRSIPEGNFFIRNIQTGCKYVQQQTWVSGHYANDLWVDGYMKTTYVSIPVYEKFVGYDLQLVGWQEPAWPDLPHLQIYRETYPAMGVIPAGSDFAAKTESLN